MNKFYVILIFISLVKARRWSKVSKFDGGSVKEMKEGCLCLIGG